MTKCDSDDKKEVFAWFGGVAYHTQCFEYEFHTMLLLLHRIQKPGITQTELDKIDTKLSKKNLNYLITETKKLCEIDSDFEKSLHQYRNKRNYLMHHFYSDNSELFLTKQGCQQIISKLKEIDNEMKEADLKIAVLSKLFMKKLGYNENEIDEYIRNEYLNIWGIDVDD